jgi:hypothetical protein
VSKIGCHARKAKANFLTGLGRGCYGCQKTVGFQQARSALSHGLTIGFGGRLFSGSAFTVDVAFWFSYPAERVQPQGKGQAVSIDSRMTDYRNKRISLGEPPVPDELQGVSKEKIRKVLARINLDKNIDLIDCVFSLLDDETISFFRNAPTGTRFYHGATTAQLACHIGILQRGKNRLDREGRDYWIKPLAELGGIEPVLLHGEKFIYGHVVPKSGNSSYRLKEEFKTILKSPDETWPRLLDLWTSQDSARERKAFHAEMLELSKQMVGTGHSELIRSSVDH